jgi:7,8-dihydroneopterin aldolase/epimerase/oxygenase
MDIITQPRIALAPYSIFIRDLVLHASIGVHAHEQQARQRIRLNIALRVLPATGEELHNVVCYDALIQALQNLCAGPHIKLAETMAERMLTLCLADARVRHARVTLEKLDVYENAAVGVTLQRENL